MSDWEAQTRCHRVDGLNRISTCLFSGFLPNIPLAWRLTRQPNGDTTGICPTARSSNHSTRLAFQGCLQAGKPSLPGTLFAVQCFLSQCPGRDCWCWSWGETKSQKHGPNTSGLSPHGNMNLWSILHVVLDTPLFSLFFISFSYFSLLLLLILGHCQVQSHAIVLTYHLSLFSWAGLSSFCWCGLSKGDGKNRVRVVGKDLDLWIPASMWLLFLIAPNTHDAFMWVLSVEMYG